MSLYQHIVFHSRHAVWVSCLAVLAANAALFTAAGTMEADPVAMGVSSQAQLTGLALLVTLMPPWLLSCFIVTQRHTLSLAGMLDKQLPSGRQLVEKVTQFPGRQIFIGTVGGLVYALAFNVPVQQYDMVFHGEWQVLGIFVGQLVVWVCVGLLLAIRLYVVGLFYQCGKSVEISIFELSGLAPFARVGMLDVVIVVGGLVIATVQSIDAQFRLENYLTAFLVAIPAAIALLVIPMWTLHQRLAARKRALLDEVRAQIENAREETEQRSIEQLESLLQRRDRVRAIHTWPLDVAFWSRLVFYVLIPPLAWAGAAFVELMVDRMLGS